MDELVADSAGLADRITRASPTALEAAIATVGAPSVRARVPVDTGALRSSVATGKSGGHASGRPSSEWAKACPTRGGSNTAAPEGGPTSNKAATSTRPRRKSNGSSGTPWAGPPKTKYGGTRGSTRRTRDAGRVARVDRGRPEQHCSIA